MQALDHEPHTWFLFQDQEQAHAPPHAQPTLLLSVSCERSDPGGSVLIELNAEERAAYAREGRPYLTTLAQAVQHTAPTALASASPYQARDLTTTRGDEAIAAARAWRRHARNTARP